MSVALLIKGFLHLIQGEAIHNILARQPTFSRDLNPEPEIVQAANAVRIWINGAPHPVGFGKFPEPPIQIQPPRVRVQFDDGFGLGSCFDDLHKIQLVRFPRQQKAAARMAQLQRIGEQSVGRFDPSAVASMLRSHGFGDMEDISFEQIVSRYGRHVQGLAIAQAGLHVVHAMH